jgi:hypothetical protein
MSLPVIPIVTNHGQTCVDYGTSNSTMPEENNDTENLGSNTPIFTQSTGSNHAENDESEDSHAASDHANTDPEEDPLSDSPEASPSEVMRARSRARSCSLMVQC